MTEVEVSVPLGCGPCESCPMCGQELNECSYQWGREKFFSYSVVRPGDLLIVWVDL